jgi:hypothetical protein
MSPILAPALLYNAAASLGALRVSAPWRDYPRAPWKGVVCIVARSSPGQQGVEHV